MATNDNQDKKDNSHFGLPKATFKPIEPSGSSNWLKITSVIAVIVLVIGVGVVYWLFKRSSSSYNDFISKTLKKQQVQEEQPLQDESPVEYFTEALEENLDKEPQRVIEDSRNTDLVQKEVITPKIQNSIQRICNPKDTYYVISASHIDENLAMDYGKELIKKHHYVALIEPTKGNHFYHLAIEKGATFKEAQKKARALKKDHKNELWIYRY